MQISFNFNFIFALPFQQYTECMYFKRLIYLLILRLHIFFSNLRVKY